MLGLSGIAELRGARWSVAGSCGWTARRRAARSGNGRRIIGKIELSVTRRNRWPVFVLGRGPRRSTATTAQCGRLTFDGNVKVVGKRELLPFVIPNNLRSREISDRLPCVGAGRVTVPSDTVKRLAELRKAMLLRSIQLMVDDLLNHKLFGVRLCFLFYLRFFAGFGLRFVCCFVYFVPGRRFLVLVIVVYVGLELTKVVLFGCGEVNDDLVNGHRACVLQQLLVGWTFRGPYYSTPRHIFDRLVRANDDHRLGCLVYAFHLKWSFGYRRKLVP